MRRWICPTCGAGVHAPDRPRKDDVRRYCLTCSAKSGRLVERSCPALDRQRATSSEKRAARTVTKREKERAAEDARWAVGAYDVRKETKRLWNLPTLRDLPYGGGQVPKVEMRRRTKYYTTGRASPWTGVTITVGTDVGYALEVLLHELLHCALGQDEDNRWHTPEFWQRLRSAVKEAWPGVDWQMQDCPQRGYVIDRYLASSLNRWIEGRND